MRETQPGTGPVPDGVSNPSYIPYFYDRGLHLFHAIPGQGAGQTTPASNYRQYDFSSDLPIRDASAIPQTVEQVIHRGYLSVPPADPTLALISDRKFSAGLGLDDLIAQSRTRHQLYQQNLYELDQGICEANNEMFRQEADQGHPANSRQRYSTHKRVQELYEQKRAERVTFWRDTSRLRLLIPEAAGQYLTAHRKVEILEDGGDSP